MTRWALEQVTTKMEVVIEHDVKRCYDCPYASNNAQEHNDPFSSSPANIYWYCNYTKQSRESVYIEDAWHRIAKDCPINS